MKGAMATGLLVSRHLGACGFKRSIRTADNITGGFHVSDRRGTVSVRWTESLEETERRLLRVPSYSVVDLPPHTDEGFYLRAYADALRPRWAVDVSGTSVTVRQRSYQEAFAPQSFYRKVRSEIEEAGARLMAGYPGTARSGVAVTREPGFVRIMVRPWIGWGPWASEVVDEANQIIMKVVRRNDWEIDCHECLEGFVIKVRSKK